MATPSTSCRSSLSSSIAPARGRPRSGGRRLGRCPTCAVVFGQTNLLQPPLDRGEIPVRFNRPSVEVPRVGSWVEMQPVDSGHRSSVYTSSVWQRQFHRSAIPSIELAPRPNRLACGPGMLAARSQAQHPVILREHQANIPRQVPASQAPIGRGPLGAGTDGLSEGRRVDEHV